MRSRSRFAPQMVAQRAVRALATDILRVRSVEDVC